MAVEWDRRVIPRWRNSNLSTLLPETRPINIAVASSKSPLNKQEVEKQLQQWRAAPDVGGAVDLLNFSHISEFQELLREPADFLRAGKFVLPRQLAQVANQIVSPSNLHHTDLNEQNFYQHFRQDAAELKNRLLVDPRNSIAWVDLARIYAALGQNEKAKESLQKAVILKPNHRFVLRAYSRFLVHNEQAEEAIFSLNKSKATLSDPWLMATHISLETVLGRTPKLLKKASSIIESGSFNPVHISELVGSVATVQAFNGEIKKAKRLFNKALIAPNDNVVAQAIWAAHRFGLQINIQDEWLSNPFSHEARYYQHISDADFEAAIREAKDWFMDEPFSARPIKAAAYISCVLGEYETAELYSRQALKIDKGDIESNNNLVFSLAAQDKIDEAVIKLSEIVKTENSTYGYNTGHTLANWGMMQFKVGNFEEGEKFYRFAIDQYERAGVHTAQAQAAAYMAREAKISKNPNAASLLSESLDIIGKYPSKIATKILTMSKLIEDKSDGRASKRIADWRYDSNSNLLIINRGLPFKVSK